MTADPSVGPEGGYVLCVGMPLRLVGEVARLLKGRVAVVATMDADGARALLGPSGTERSGPVQHTPARGEPPVVGIGGPGPDRTAPFRGRHSAVPGPPTPQQAENGRRWAPPVPEEWIGGHPSTGGLRVVGPVTEPVPAVGPVSPPGGVPAVGRLVRGPLEVDVAAREVTARGSRIHLSMREFDLLLALASDIDRVWSFAELTHRVWRTGYLGDPDPVISAVKRLRKRLQPVPELEVASVRGVGYRLLVPA